MTLVWFPAAAPGDWKKLILANPSVRDENGMMPKASKRKVTKVG